MCPEKLDRLTSLEHDVFGRHFYYGVDDKGRREKIFHSFPLQLGEIYLFFPLTNPARINPLIVPYEYEKKKDSEKYVKKEVEESQVNEKERNQHPFDVTS